MSIDTGFGPLDAAGPTYVPGQTDGQGTGTFDARFLSTLSPSQQQALAAYFIMNLPILAAPNDQGVKIDGAAVNASISLQISQIGSDIWDKYIEYLAQEEQRLRDYLKSPAYQLWLDQHKPAQAGDGASSAWLHSIDGLSNYISNAHDLNPQAAQFMVASVVIAGTIMGTGVNVPDVVSTNLVSVNPIQDAVGSVVSSLPPNFQDTLALTINLFAVGAVYTAAAEVIAKGKAIDPKELDLEMAKSYAKNVCDKVDSNEINYCLMALLVHHTEDGVPLTNEKFNKLAAMVKMIMISIAMAVLYKVEAGAINGLDFKALVNGDLQPRTEEEKELVASFTRLKGERAISSQEWDEVIEGLAGFFDKNPAVNDIMNPVKVYASVNSTVTLGEVKD